MSVDVLGPTLSFAVFVVGIWIGWLLTRLKEGEISVPAAGFFRGTTKPLRVGAEAFGGAALAVLVRLVADALDSTALVYVSLAIGALSIGIGWGAMTRAFSFR